MIKLLWSSIFIVFINSAIFSKVTDGFERNPAFQGSGINFYGEMSDTTALRLPEEMFFNPFDCLEDFNSEERLFLNDPDICCDGSEPIQCDDSYPYRKYDGSCNNPYVPSLGMPEMCFLRLIPPSYEGKDGLRKSVTGDPLPKARDISLNILKDKHRPTEKATFLFTMYGQFIAHDMSEAVGKQISGSCCSPQNMKNKECIPIFIRSNDPFYSRFNITCINVQRNEECTLCKSAHRSQKNAVTAAIDATTVYGVTQEHVQQLRTNDGTGKLKSSGINNGYLLPGRNDGKDPFCPKSQPSNCFLAGDGRVNLHASLTTLHTIFMREHNRIAGKLKRLNPHWGEEKLFQEARNILIATLQCITYKEYLDLLLGTRIVKLFDLSVKQGKRGTSYNPQVKLGTAQEFTVASFRLHSMVPTYIGLSNLQFRNTFSNPNLVRDGGIFNITSGSYRVPSEKNDPWIVTDLSNFFNHVPGNPFGSDLSAIDIQRGRDHGLAPYVEVVKFCSSGAVTISSFGDLYELSLMPKENIILLQKIYKDVQDVDMWVGMQLEYPFDGSLLGPSATCINAIQFYITQKGDYFYFDHEGSGASFTSDQRNALKKCSIARVLCDNTKNTHVTENPFLLPSYENPDVSCKEIPKIDLTPWKESASAFED